MDRMKQAQDAMKTAGSPDVQQMQQQAMAGGGMDVQQGMSDRAAMGPTQQGADGVATVKLRLHIAPLNESDIKTTQTVAIQQGRMLAAGDLVTVKFDPNDRKSFVLLDDTYAVRDQFGNVSQFAPGAGTPA
jgi:hypothetical protein